MAHEVTLIAGDGTGPELAEAARKCIDATGVEINRDLQEAGLGVVFEATHGSAHKHTYMNKVSPTALIMSGMLMRRPLNEIDAADRLEKAIAQVIAEQRSDSRRHPAYGRSDLPADVNERL